MARTTINISLPESMRIFVDGRVSDADYGSVSEYFRELVRMDQRRERELMNAAFERRPTENADWLSPADAFDL